MGKKKKRSTGLKAILVYMGIVFTGMLFILKIFLKSIGWLDVFAPLLAAFLIIFLLSAVKAVIKKI
ncbi:MAG TPA: hypothetical protein VK489_08185 [Ferruginibacter sp.]|nr:hypothetical protein [Ferruginibacter sp.]